ncbi:MAG: tetratricopeptide repeat protein [Brasilonema octagenarum HA4186-MV1]|jgi:tetratricopeptide (TPR) repeat protein|nr:tetratricopeptide repeat protein [Brasilonema octagenarum HA4186-MV1]
MKKILILSANPINTNNLRLDEEVREIQAAWERAFNREKFELINKGAVRIDELRRTLLDHKPQIVHFSGHGTGTNGLVLENNSGEAQIVSTESLSSFFELSKEQVECVLLNACYSETQAEAIFQHIDCVIGMGQSIPDNSAILFSKGFYDAIFGGRNYADAFKCGCNNIDLNNLSEFNTPTIKIRHRDFIPEDSFTTQPYTPLFFIGTVVFGLIISLLGLFRLVHHDYGLITHILLGFGLITFWLCCAYIYYPSSRIAGFNINFFRRFKQYKKLRRLALAGMVIIPLLGITGFYILELPTKNIIVLLADYNQAIKLDPNYAQAYYSRGVFYFSKKDYDRAIADFNKAIQLDPHYAQAYNNRGIYYANQKDYDRAIADFNQAIKLDPNYTQAYNNRGNSYAHQQDYDRAIADFNQAIKLDPKYTQAYNNRGIYYANQQDYDRAIADFNQAIKLDPNDAQAYYNRGNSYFEQKGYDRAIADYNQAIKLDPNYAQTYYSRGTSYAYKKDYDRAIADYNQAIKLDPNYAQAYYNRGYSYFYKKDYDRAIADYNQAIKLDPNDAAAYDSRCELYRIKKDYDRAIANCNQAIILDSNLTDAYYNRGLVYKNKGKKDKAIQDLKKILQLNNDVELNEKAKQELKELNTK